MSSFQISFHRFLLVFVLGFPVLGHASLYSLDNPSAAIAPHHAYDAQFTFKIDQAAIAKLKLGDTHKLNLPDGRVVASKVVKTADEDGQSESLIVLSMSDGLGSKCTAVRMVN